MTGGGSHDKETEYKQKARADNSLVDAYMQKHRRDKKYFMGEQVGLEILVETKTYKRAGAQLYTPQIKPKAIQEHISCSMALREEQQTTIDNMSKCDH